MTVVRTVLTIAALTLREASRRRVLLALASLTVVLIGFSGWGFSRVAAASGGAELTSGGGVLPYVHAARPPELGQVRQHEQDQGAGQQQVPVVEHPGELLPPRRHPRRTVVAAGVGGWRVRRGRVGRDHGWNSRDVTHPLRCRQYRAMAPSVPSP